MFLQFLVLILDVGGCVEGNEDGGGAGGEQDQYQEAVQSVGGIFFKNRDRSLCDLNP